jgi:hypothetical protein
MIDMNVTIDKKQKNKKNKKTNIIYQSCLNEYDLYANLLTAAGKLSHTLNTIYNII